MRFRLEFSINARTAIQRLEADASARVRLKKVRKVLAFLEEDPRHPGLRVHPFHSLQGPNGEAIFEAFVENQTAGAWRVWFWYGPERETITILMIVRTRLVHPLQTAP